MSNQKLCENCKYFVPSESWTTTRYKNMHAICSRTSLVTTDSGESCREERTKRFFFSKKCGVEGRFFEASK